MPSVTGRTVLMLSQTDGCVWADYHGSMVKVYISGNFTKTETKIKQVMNTDAEITMTVSLRYTDT